MKERFSINYFLCLWSNDIIYLLQYKMVRMKVIQTTILVNINEILYELEIKKVLLNKTIKKIL